MRHFLASLLLLAAPAMAADMVSKQGNDSARITDKPCPVEVLKVIEQGQRGDFRAAFVVFQGKQFAACWRMMGNLAFLVYADGDQGVIPLADFKPDEGV